VTDTVAALRGLMEPGTATGDLFNVGSQERVAIRDLAERVRARVGSASEIVFVPYEDVYPHGAIEEMFHREPSLEKIAGAIGWSPTKKLDDILDDVIAYERDRVEATA
jgi:UDP-glucose 4-epimerase